MQVPSELSALEAVAATPLGGRARSAPALAKTAQDPIAAVAAAIEGALDAGPPAVAFSGGRDSSLLLAVATRVCRRAGIEPPLPVTLCMPSAFAETDERGWQERVLKHLKLPDWHRIPITGELDLIGQYARRHLLRDGLLFPANAHSVVPMLEATGRRCLIVGAGGDELLSPQQWWSVHDLLGRRRSPQQRDLVRLTAAAIPRPLRGLTRRSWAAELNALKWLRPAAKARLNISLRMGFEEPVRWRTAVRDAAARREVVLPLRSMQRLAGASGQNVLAPLLDPVFVGALAATGGYGGGEREPRR